MTYQEFAEKANEIIQAIKDGNYEVELDAPNFVSEHTTSDGRTVLIVYDADGPKSSSDCGGGSYTVCGENFYVQFEFFELEEVTSSFFDEAKNLTGDPDSIEDDVEDLIDVIKDELRGLSPSFSDVDDQAAAYAEAMGIEYDAAYWYEDEDCPHDDEED